MLKKTLKLLAVFGLCICMLTACNKGTKTTNSDITEKEQVRAIVVSDILGKVNITRSNEDVKASKGMSLLSGDQITVNKNSGLIVQIDDDKYLYVDSNSEFIIDALLEDNNSLTNVSINKGSILFQILNPLKEKDEFSVTTPTSVMQVRGTTFRVSIQDSSDNHTYESLQVYKGEVLATINDSQDKVSVSKGKSVLIQEKLTDDEKTTFVFDSQISDAYWNNLNADVIVNNNAKKEGDVILDIPYNKLPLETIDYLLSAVDKEDDLCITEDELLALKNKNQQKTLEPKVDNKQEETHTSGGESSGGGQSSKAPGAIETIPVASPDSPIDWDGSEYDLLDTSVTPESSTGTIMYCVTLTDETPDKSLFTEDSPRKTDAGHYYVWYYSKGDSTHEDTTPAYIEVIINGTNISDLSAPSLKSGLTYDGSEQTLTNSNGSTTQGSLYLAVTTENVTPSLSGFTYGAMSEIKRKDAGTYYIWYWVDGDSGKNDILPTSAGSVTIAKVTPTITGQTFNDLTFNDTDQSFVDNGGTVDYGTLQYALGNNGTTAPTSGWTTNATSLKKKNFGTYYVWYKVDGSSNWNAIAPECNERTIAQATTSLTTDVGLNGADLVYQLGVSNELITTAGVPNFGTIEYALGSDGTNAPTSGWKTNRLDSSLKKTNAGKYYVWYRVVGNDNYSTIPATYKGMVEIEKADGSVTGTPQPVANLVYNGSAKNLITNTGVSGTGTVVYLATTTNTQPSDTTGFSSAIPQGTDVDDYYIWYAALESENYKESAIQKLTNPVHIGQERCPITTNPSLATGLAYTGSAQQLVTSAGVCAGTFKFVIGTNGTDAPDFSSPIDDITSNSLKGTNAGDYYIWCVAYPTDTGNYDSTDPAYLGKVTIAKVDPTVTPPSVNGSLTAYSNSDQQLISAGDTGTPSTGTMKYALGTNATTTPTTGWTTDATSIKGKDAKKYYVWYYVAGDNNHYDSLAACMDEIEITKATATVTTGPTAASLSYTGSAQDLLVTTSVSCTTGTLEYSLDDGTTWSTTVPQKTDADTYTVKYRDKGNDNYNASTAGSVDVTINPANITVTNPTAIEDLSPSASPKNLIVEGSTDHGTFMYALTSTSTAPADSAYSTTIPQGDVAGTYYVWWFVDNSADTNYKGTTPASITVTLQSGITPATTTTPVGATGLEYNKQLQALVATPGDTNGTGTIVYAVTDASVTTAPQTNTFGYNNASLPKAKDAGNYKVWYYVQGTDPYVDSSISSITVSIAKVNATITTPPTGVSGLVASGAAKQLINTTGAVCDTDFEYSLDSGATWSTTIPTATTHGTYTILYRAGGNTNYNAYTPDPNTITVTIEKPLATVTAPTAIVGLSSTGDALTLINAGSSNGTGTIVYAVNTDQYTQPASGAFSDTLPTETNPGTYYVWYYVQGDSDHRDSNATTTPDGYGRTISNIQVKVKADKATVTTLPTAVEGLSFNNTEQTLINAGVSNTNIMKYALTTVNTAPEKSVYGASLPKAKEPGTYYIWYYAGANEIHGDSDVCASPIVVTIGKIAATYVSTPSANTTLSYNDSDQDLLSSLGQSDEGTIKFLVKATQPAKEEIISSSNPQAKDAGTYFVWYYIQGDADHNDSAISSTTVTISKGAGVVDTPPSAVDPAPEYNNGNLLTIATEGVSSTGTMMYYVSTDTTLDDSSVFESKKALFKTTIDKKKYNGTYYVYYYSKGDSNHLDSDYGHIIATIGGSGPQIVAPTSKTLTYNTSHPANQLLIDPGSCDGYTMLYAVSTDVSDVPAKAAFAPYNNADPNPYYPVAKEPGRYYVWYYAKSISGAPDTDIEYVISYIQSKAEYSIYPSRKSNGKVLTDGSPIEPITQGITNDGTVMYCIKPYVEPEVCPEKGEYSSSIPQVSAPGKYRFYHYISGDDLHTDFGYQDDFGARIPGQTFTVVGQAKFITHPTLLDGIDNEGTYTYTLPVPGTDPVLNFFCPIQDVGTVNGGVALYSLSAPDLPDSIPAPPVNNHGTWEYKSFVKAENINDLKVIGPGTYKLYYCVLADPEVGEEYLQGIDLNANPYPPYETISFTIGRPKAYFTVEPQVQTDSSQLTCRRYDSKCWLLQSFGEWVGGDIKFAITLTDTEPTAEEYSFDQPYRGVGHYYIWAKITAGADYVASDVYGPYEVTVTGTGASVNPATPITGLVYNGEDQQLVNLATYAEPCNGQILYAVRKAGPDVSTNDGPSDTAYSSNAPKAKLPGTYQVWFKSEGLTSFDKSGANMVNVTIAKATQTVTAASANENEMVADGTTVFELLDNENLPVSSVGNEIEYYVTTSDVAPNADTIWGTYNSTKKKDVGMYYVWYRGAEDEKYLASEPSYVVSMIKGECPIKVQPSVKGDFGHSIGYTGSDLSSLIINEGSSDYGQMMYGLGSKSGAPSIDAFSSSLPEIIEPGEYFVWYYVKSTSPLYGNSRITNIGQNITVDKAEGSITTHPSIENSTYSSGDYIVYYTGSEVVINEGVSPDGEIKYAVTGPNAKAEADSLVPFSEIEAPKDVSDEPYSLFYAVFPSDTAHYKVPEGGNGLYHFSFRIIKAKATATGGEANSGQESDGTSPITLLSEAPIADYGTIKYAVSSSSEDKPDIGTFTEGIPTRIFGGTYYVWYYATGNSVYDPSDIYDPIEVTIDAGSFVVPAVTPISNLKYNGTTTTPGTAQPLVTVGSLGGGTMYYAVDSAPKNSKAEITSTSIPEKTYAGTYYVSYWFDFGDSEHESEVYSVPVTIDYADCLITEEQVPVAVTGLTFDPFQWQTVAQINNPNPEYKYYYAISDALDQEPAQNEFAYHTELPTCGGAGTRYIWWYAVDKNPADQQRFAPTTPQAIEFNIAKLKHAFTKCNIDGAIADVDGSPVISYIHDVYDQNGGVVRFYLSTELCNTTAANFKNNFETAWPAISTPGTYYLYVYVSADGSGDYEDSNIEVKQITATQASTFVNPPSPTYTAYNGDLFPLVNGGETDSLKEYHLVYAIGSKDVAPDISAYSDQVPMESEPGDYYVYYTVFKGPYRLPLVTPGKVKATIEKGEPGLKNPPVAYQNLVETGSEIDLLRSGAVYNDDSLIVEYAVLDIDTYSNLGSANAFTDDLFSTELPKVIEAGNYALAYRSKANSHYKTSGISIIFPTVESANGQDPKGYASPYRSGTKLQYNGQDQVILSQLGSSDVATYLYAVATYPVEPSAGSFSSAAPTVKDCNFSEAADETVPYYIYYKKQYTNGYIGKTHMVESYLSPKPTRMKTEAAVPESITYDGQVHNLVDTMPTSDDGCIAFIVSQEPIPASDLLDESALSLAVFEPSVQEFLNNRYEDYAPGMGVGDFLIYLDQTLHMDGYPKIGIPKAKDAGHYYLYYVAFPDYWMDYLVQALDVEAPAVTTDTRMNYTITDPGCVYLKEVDIIKTPCEIVTDPVAITGLEWNNNQPITLVTDGTTSVAGEGKFMYAVTTTNVQPDRSLFKPISEGGASAYNVGTYYVWYYATAGDLYADSEVRSLTAEIGGNGPNITAPVGKTGLHFIDFDTDLDLFDTLPTSTTGTVRYAISADVTQPPIGQFLSIVPKGCTPGTYYIWYYSDGPGDFDTIPEYITVTVGKGQAELIKAPHGILETERYICGEAKQMFVEGEAKNGTLKYYLRNEYDRDQSDNLDNYSDSIPLIEWGEMRYYLSYYVDGGSYCESTGINTISIFVRNDTGLLPHEQSILPTPAENVKTNSGYVPLTQGGEAARGWRFVYYVAKEGSDYFMSEPDLAWFEAVEDEPKANCASTPGQYRVYVAVDKTFESWDPERHLKADFIVSVEKGKAVFENYPLPNDNTEFIPIQGTRLVKEDTGLPGDPANYTTMYLKTTDPWYTPTMSDSFEASVPCADCPGTWYVWAYIKAGENGFDSDLTSFTITIDKMDRGPLTPPNLITTADYTGSPIQIFNAWGDDALQYCITRSSAIPALSQFKQHPKFIDDESVKVKDPGVYYVWYYAPEDGSYNATLPEYRQVAIIDLSGNAPFVTPSSYVSEYTYDGSEHAFITTPFTTNDGNTVYYALIENDPNQPEIGGKFGDPYKTDISELKGTDAGTYYIWYKAKDAGGNDVTTPSCITITINKTNAAYTMPSILPNLVYSNKSIKIADPGVTEHGQFLYSLTEFAAEPLSNTFKETIDKVKGAGTYYLWWKIEADHNHENVGPYYLEVEVAEQELPPIAPTGVTIEYDYGPHILINPGRATSTTEYRYYYGSNNIERPENLDEYVNINSLERRIEPGTYYIWYITHDLITGENSDPNCFTSEIIDTPIHVINPPVGNTDLVWNGGPQNLIYGYNAWDSGNCDPYGVVMFKVTQDPNVVYTLADAADNNIFNDWTPAEATDPGTYYVWYAAKTNADPVEYSLPQYVVAKINGIGTAEVVFAPVLVNSSLAYSSFEQQQQIIDNPGNVNNGTMMYAMKDVDDTTPISTSDFSDKTPYTHDVGVGTFNFYYYAKGNNGYADSEIQQLDNEVYIDGPDNGWSMEPMIAESGNPGEELINKNGVPNAGTTYYAVKYTNNVNLIADNEWKTYDELVGEGKNVIPDRQGNNEKAYVFYYVNSYDSTAKMRLFKDIDPVCVEVHINEVEPPNPNPVFNTEISMDNIMNFIQEDGTGAGRGEHYVYAYSEVEETPTDFYQYLTFTQFNKSEYAQPKAEGTYYIYWLIYDGTIPKDLSVIQHATITVTAKGGGGKEGEPQFNTNIALDSIQNFIEKDCSTDKITYYYALSFGVDDTPTGIDDYKTYADFNKDNPQPTKEGTYYIYWFPGEMPKDTKQIQKVAITVTAKGGGDGPKEQDPQFNTNIALNKVSDFIVQDGRSGKGSYYYALSFEEDKTPADKTAYKTLEDFNKESPRPEKEGTFYIYYYVGTMPSKTEEIKKVVITVTADGGGDGPKEQEPQFNTNIALNKIQNFIAEDGSSDKGKYYYAVSYDKDMAPTEISAYLTREDFDKTDLAHPDQVGTYYMYWVISDGSTKPSPEDIHKTVITVTAESQEPVKCSITKDPVPGTEGEPYAGMPLVLSDGEASQGSIYYYIKSDSSPIGKFDPGNPKDKPGEWKLFSELGELNKGQSGSYYNVYYCAYDPGDDKCIPSDISCFENITPPNVK